MRKERVVKGKPGTAVSPLRRRICSRTESLFEKSVQLVLELMHAQSSSSVLSDKYYIRLGWHFFPIQPEVFSEPPLDPISSASVPSFPADRYSQPSYAHRVLEHSDMKMGRVRADTSSHDSPIVGGVANSSFFVKLKTPRFRPTGVCVLLPFSA